MDDDLYVNVIYDFGYILQYLVVDRVLRLKDVKLRNWRIVAAPLRCSQFFMLLHFSYYLLRRYALNVQHYIKLIRSLWLLSELLNFFLAAIPWLIIILEILILGGGLRPLSNISVFLHRFELGAKLTHILSLKLLKCMNLGWLRTSYSWLRSLIYIRWTLNSFLI